MQGRRGLVWRGVVVGWWFCGGGGVAVVVAVGC